MSEAVHALENQSCPAGSQDERERKLSKVHTI